jgi:hypothetical protein
MNMSSTDVGSYATTPFGFFDFFFGFRAGALDGPSGAVDLFNVLDTFDTSIPLLATGANGAVVSGDNVSFL